MIAYEVPQILITLIILQTQSNFKKWSLITHMRVYEKLGLINEKHHFYSEYFVPLIFTILILPPPHFIAFMTNGLGKLCIIIYQKAESI